MRILVVEGELKIAKILASCLRQVGYAVDSVHDGKNGLYCASIHYYDLIIIDLDLKIISGEEVCETLRNEGKNCPIVILSASSSVDVKLKLFDLGVDDFIVKPFSMNELTARVKAILRRPSKLSRLVETFGEHILDIQGRTFFHGKNEIRLTKKEFSLLELLLGNKNEVLSRGIIMEHVWDMNADPFSNTIETHIRNLRKKLKDHNAKKIIVTIPGIGYKICC